MSRTKKIVDQLREALNKGVFDLETIDVFPKQIDSREVFNISVFRREKWITVPSNLLVEGDRVRLCDGDFAPCTLELFSKNNLFESFKLEKGEKFESRKIRKERANKSPAFDEKSTQADTSLNDKLEAREESDEGTSTDDSALNNQPTTTKIVEGMKFVSPSQLSHFVNNIDQTKNNLQNENANFGSVLRTYYEFKVVGISPASTQIRDSLQRSLLLTQLELFPSGSLKLEKAMTIACVICFSISLLINLLIFAFKPQNYFWQEMFLLRQAYLLIPFLFLISGKKANFLWYVWECFVDSKLLAIFYHLSSTFFFLSNQPNQTGEGNKTEEMETTPNKLRETSSGKEAGKGDASKEMFEEYLSATEELNYNQTVSPYSLPFSLHRALCTQLLWGSKENHYPRLLRAIASPTVISFCEIEGILTETVEPPATVLFSTQIEASPSFTSKEAILQILNKERNKNAQNEGKGKEEMEEERMEEEKMKEERMEEERMEEEEQVLRFSAEAKRCGKSLFELQILREKKKEQKLKFNDSDWKEHSKFLFFLLLSFYFNSLTDFLVFFSKQKSVEGIGFEFGVEQSLLPQTPLLLSTNAQRNAP